MIEDNDLTGNKRGAWDIAEESEPNVKRSGNRDDEVVRSGHKATR